MNAQCSIPNISQVYENEEYLDTPVKVEPMSEDEQDLPMECLLCSKRFMSISGLKAHVIAQHNYKTVRRKMNNSASPEKKKTAKISCTTCGRNFVTLTDLMVHETCHNKSVCYACGGKFDSYGLLMKHHRRWCKKLKNSSSKPNCREAVVTPLPTSVKTKNKPAVSLKCLNCNEEFSDLYDLKVHSEIHNSDNKNDQLENYEQVNSGDVNASECDENSEQTNEFHATEIEIKLEITNVVTLKDQMDYIMDDPKNNDEPIEEEANEVLKFEIHKQLESFETGSIPDIVENSDQDFIDKNKEQLTKESDMIGQKCFKSFNVDDETKTRVGQDENRVDLFENDEHDKAELSKTNEDELMINNKNKDENDLAKIMLLETDA